jgi:hypothetical protein
VSLASPALAAVSAATPAGYRLGGETIGRRAMAAIALASVVAAMLVRPIWRVGRLAVTAVHEGGHVVAAIVCGRKVTTVHLRADTSGVTYHEGSGRRGGRVVTAAAGYPAPGVLAVGGAALLAHQRSRAWLALLACMGAVLLIRWVRNAFGITLVAVSVAVLGWLVVAATGAVTALVGTIAAWYLAIGGLRAATEQFGAGVSADALVVARLLHLPVVVCKAGFLVAASAAVAGSAILLFGLP